MDKVCHDKGKEVHARLDFREGSRERRTREGSHYSSARTLSARPERLKLRDRLSYSDGHVFDRLGKTSFKDRSRSRSRPHRLDASNGDRPKNKECFYGIGESYDNSYSSYETWINHKYRYHDRDCSCHMKRGRDSESSSSSVSKSDSSDGRHHKSKLKRHKPTDEDDLMIPWMCAKQKKYVKDPVEIHNIKQKDRETIEDFMERFKVKTERIKGAAECMQIFKFMHGVNNLKLKKRLNEHVPKTMEEMIIITTTFIRREATAASKKKGHTSWRTQDQSKREITFPPLSTSSGAEGPLIIEVEIGRHMIHRMYVDGGSSMEVLYENCFNWLRTEVKNQMVSATTSLTGFSGETIWPLGQLRLLNKENSSGTIHSLGMLKFPADGGIVTIRSTILVPVECATEITSSEEVAIRGTLSVKGRIELCSLLKENLDIFAWQPSDMTGVPRSVAEQRLNTREGYSPVRSTLKMYVWAVEGMFLGFMITMEGIKLFPDKTEAVLQLPSLRTIKEVQSLNGKLASLHRFLSKSAEKSLPLFKTLKKCIKKINFHWTSKTKQAFKQLKQHLSELPLLVAPKPKVELIVYLFASYGAISAVLMTKKGMVQMPVYFVSRALQGPELNYTPMEKLVLSLVFTDKRLRRYFQAHPIVVIIDQPIKQIMYHPNVAGRLQKWSVMLREHNITYRPRTSVKGQVLADFLAEMSDESLPDTSVAETQQEPWTFFTNGSSCVDGCGAGLILTSPEGKEFTYTLRFQFAAFNNEAEYEALIAGAYVAKEENMIKYLENVKSLVIGFTNFSINQVMVEILKEKSMQEKEVTTIVEEDGPKWMTPIREYLKEGTLPSDRKVARKLRIKARQYKLLEGHACKTTVSGGQSHTFGILLANDASGRMRYNTYMQRLSNTSSRDKKPPAASNPDHDSVAILQSNGLVERANRSLGEGIKACLGEGNKNWVEELPHVLWDHRTMIKSSHGDTPFSLTYETEAVIPAEIGMPTYLTAAVDVVHNGKELRLNLDLLEERCERAAIREAKAKSKMTKYYNARVCGVTFRPCDFVYRSNDASHAVDGGKLGPK
uniref:Reverse transcriptase domain-containing protein n=1 Tax=Tanacetum cinerariifolium TaxID=118510 RepID=A0A699GU00_TANCI|nr:reverse transcriptase domain-containing protein [Tanacetum cinerariifolium]